MLESKGELLKAHTVSLKGTGKTITAKNIILAPGSIPFVPPGIQVRQLSGTPWSYPSGMDPSGTYGP